jgi:heme oxygenase (biliverdin-IX-beta and delta-forming)
MTTNSSPLSRQHAHTGPLPPQLPEPGYAERVRTLLSQSAIGTLSTLSHKREGFPFGSLMPYALDAHGRPIFLISSMAMHTQNLNADPRASLFVAQGAADEDPLGSARATLIGEARRMPENDLAEARVIYLAKHPNSKYWIDFADFSFFRLEVLEVYYVGGFGVMGWVEGREYVDASPDPLAPSADAIIAHMNADHVDAMILLARTHAGIDAAEAAMTAVDRLGFHLRLKTAEGMKGTRINYPGEVRTPQEARKALVEMVGQARQSESSRQK